MFSQTTEYALRATTFLAACPDRPQVSQQISDATKVPVGYLAKVLQLLGRAKLVQAQRGLHGGFTLARPASEITILDVVNAVTPIERITQCPLGIPDHVSLCPLHRRLDDAVALVESALGSTTLADMVAEPSASKPLCDPNVRVTPTVLGKALSPAGKPRGRKRVPVSRSRK